jgi:prepilin-type N-terminal cleavage/methylation domain-containing protein
VKHVKLNKVKGFTIIEVLVTLALTSIAITLGFATLNYVQKLFYDYKKQNKFIQQYTDLKWHLDVEKNRAERVIEISENNFEISRDSLNSNLILQGDKILLKRNDRCDTFFVKAENIKKEYLQLNNPKWSNKLVTSLKFESYYSKQKFIFYFYKDYDASAKLEMERSE